MLEVEHKEIIRKIEGGTKEVGIIPTLMGGNFPLNNYFIESIYKDRVGIIPVLLKSNFDLSDFFIESNYKDITGYSLIPREA